MRKRSEDPRSRGRSRVRRSLLATLVPAALLGAGCARPPADAPPLADFEAAGRKEDIVRMTGMPATRCTWSRPQAELCTWRLANRDSAWWTLAPTVDTKYQVNLVCEFPTDGSATARACTVFPRKSLPVAVLPQVASRSEWAATDRYAPEPSREPSAGDSRGEAQRQLDEAETVAQMTALVGDVPDLCEAVSGGRQFCTWKAGNQAQGYELLAATIDTRKRVQLSCTFPSDGGPRASGSCRVEAP
jgi:hypothetical protein